MNSILRRILGIFVMIAGVIGLLLSLAGLVGIWIVKPGLTASIETTLGTLSTSIDTSQKTLVVTSQALEGVIQSVNSLSDVLSTTSVTVKDTRPVIAHVHTLLGDTVPTTIQAAGTSLNAAQDAARSLEDAIKSFESFRALLKSIPLFGAVLPSSQQSYNPQTPLSASLGDLSTSIQDMPASFKDMAANLDKADNNLETIQTDLDSMSKNVALISTSLAQYQTMVDDSQSSMDDLKTMITEIQGNLVRTINIVTIVLGLFFLWLLAAQVVIFSQGWELYQGTAGHMEGSTPKPVPVAVESEK
jgi:methyl-accepting chemotaxis protein